MPARASAIGVPSRVHSVRITCPKISSAAIKLPATRLIPYGLAIPDAPRDRSGIFVNAPPNARSSEAASSANDRQIAFQAAGTAVDAAPLTARDAAPPRNAEAHVAGSSQLHDISPAPYG